MNFLIDSLILIHERDKFFMNMIKFCIVIVCLSVLFSSINSFAFQSLGARGEIFYIWTEKCAGFAKLNLALMKNSYISALRQKFKKQVGNFFVDKLISLYAEFHPSCLQTEGGV